MNTTLSQQLQSGIAIPAHPLALDSNRRLDERRQRALTRYYLAAGAGGAAVGVHTTQFVIHESNTGLYEPVLALAAEEFDRYDLAHATRSVRVAGILGLTDQAVRESELAKSLGYHCGLLSLGALKNRSLDEVLAHCSAVAEVIPVFGFFLQEAVGGIPLPYEFWRRFCEIENVVAIKIAAFNRYETLEVVRALVDSGRTDIVLYTGNDDNIVIDLLTRYRFQTGEEAKFQEFTGGLLGHWSYETNNAVQMLEHCKAIKQSGDSFPQSALILANEVTDLNAAVFDAKNNFAGCIPGIHEVLRRHGLLEGTWCIDPDEQLSPGQSQEIDRTWEAYPHLRDDAFIAEHLEEWLAG